jgi:hypothetical protein
MAHDQSTLFPLKVLQAWKKKFRLALFVLLLLGWEELTKRI